MFVPPDQRQPRLPPWQPRKPARRLTKRGEAVVLWLVGFFLVSMLIAPIGGSTLLHAVWYLLNRH